MKRKKPPLLPSTLPPAHARRLCSKAGPPEPRRVPVKPIDAREAEARRLGANDG